VSSVHARVLGGQNETQGSAAAKQVAMLRVQPISGGLSHLLLFIEIFRFG
jgi:hypothetical protein